jgi:hypothetical protein
MQKLWVMLAMGLCLTACGDDGDDGTEADQLGVGAQCTSTADCLHEEDAGVHLTCLLQFKGGYCGVEDCDSNDDCPDQSVCVAHEDGSNYCFRSCVEKVECNENRDADQEANCSGNTEFVDTDTEGKACVPPSA